MTAPGSAVPGSAAASGAVGHVRSMTRLGLALGAGAILGAAAWTADQFVYPWNVLIPANAVGAWVAVAFATGALGTRPLGGALRGLAALLVGVAVYELLTGTLGYGVSSGGAVHASLVWGTVAAVIGPVFGLAGATWRGSRGWPRAIAAAFLGAALIAEGVGFGGARLVHVGQLVYDPGALLLAGEIAVGLALPWLLLRPGERRSGYLAMVVLAVLAAVAIEPVTALVRGIADRF